MQQTSTATRPASPPSPDDISRLVLARCLAAEMRATLDAERPNDDDLVFVIEAPAEYPTVQRLPRVHVLDRLATDAPHLVAALRDATNLDADPWIAVFAFDGVSSGPSSSSFALALRSPAGLDTGGPFVTKHADVLVALHATAPRDHVLVIDAYVTPPATPKFTTRPRMIVAADLHNVGLPALAAQLRRVDPAGDPWVIVFCPEGPIAGPAASFEVHVDAAARAAG